MMTGSRLLEAVAAYLLEGGYGPGDRLPTETELATHFGVSRGALREVLMHLCFLGVLERATSRGTHVCAVDPGRIVQDLAFRLELSGYSFAELKETRLCIETALLPLLVRRLTPEAAEALCANVSRMETLSGEPAQADLLDKGFHLQLLDVCGNRTLRIFSHVIARLFDRAFRERFLNTEAARDHRAILEALTDGDVDRARAILTAHISAT
jgi:DNA-binding FadR family transcriptional regulator